MKRLERRRCFSIATAFHSSFRAFSSEVETGSRQENASNQESRAPFRFYRNGKGRPARTRPTLRRAEQHLARAAGLKPQKCQADPTKGENRHARNRNGPDWDRKLDDLTHIGHR